MQTSQPTIFPMASAQERLWIVEQLIPGTAAYHIPLAIRLTGPLDRAALHAAVQAVVDRHEALRTVFTQLDGEAVQVVTDDMRIGLPVVDVTEAGLEARLGEEAARPFDLTTGPLVRTSLLRLADDDHVWTVTLHHLVSDMWSCGILVQEVSAAYTARTSGRELELPELPVHYPDFAVWQREKLSGEYLEQLLGHWRDRLAGAPHVTGLPLDRPRPAVQSFRGRQLQVTLTAELAAGVRQLSQRSGATPFMTLLAAFQLLLSRYSGQDDIVVSTGVATRTPETERVIGCFINTVLLRTSLAGDPSFAGLLDRVRETTLDALDHQDLPFERLVGELGARRDLSVNPLAQVMFILQNAPVPAITLPGLGASVVGVERGGAQLDLDVQLREEDGTFTGFVEYAEDLFDEATVQRLWRHYEMLLTAAVAGPERAVSELPLLTAAELEQTVAQWNDTAAPAPRECLHQLFENQVAVQPEAPALAWTGGEMSYAELNRRAERVAGRLRSAGVGPDVRVAVCLNRSVAMAVAVLGVLKAGGAYVPLDAAYPADRLSFMLADARPVALITDAALLDRLPVEPGTGRVTGAEGGFEVEVLLADALEAAAQTVPGPQPGVASGHVTVRPDHLAYVIYTSGSTGRPKGIAVTHRGVVNNIADLNRGSSIGPGDSVLCLSSLSFDMSVYELLGMLAAGGTTVLPDADSAKDPRHWAELIERHSITVWNSAPTLLEALVASYGDGRPTRATLRVAFLGGDWVPVPLPDRARALFPALDVIVMGGATEASIHSIVQPVGRTGADWVHIPYGRPMANQQALIVDTQLRAVPVGVPGELCLAGAGLARSYLGRPALTADRFVPHPYAGVYPGIPDGARLYRTGDLARYGADGTIHLIGRLDHQVKVRGFRIELGEIDAALGRHPRIAESVCVVRVDEQGLGIGLTAYVVPAQGDAPTTGDLREHLMSTLPDHMVPDVFVALEALPLSANGKVDRRALPAVADAGSLALSTEFVLPSNPVERAIADLWSAVLDVDRVGAHDNFFELSGNSLGVTQVAAAISSNLRVDVPLRALFEAPTVAGQAALTEAAGQAAGLDVAAVSTLYLQVRAMSSAQVEDLLNSHEETDR